MDATGFFLLIAYKYSSAFKLQSKYNILHLSYLDTTPQILDPSMKDWYQYRRPWNLTHRAQLRESRHMTYHTTTLLPNSCGPMADGSFRDPKDRLFTYIGPIDWYQCRPWNLTHRAHLRESRHMTYTTTLLPNNCGQTADGLFRNPQGRSYPHPKYWTHRWRIDTNIGHGISPREPS